MTERLPAHEAGLPVPEPVLLAAFEGWNDAGAAATHAVAHLSEMWGAEQIDELDPEEFHDFQVNRPIVEVDPTGERRITWPTTTISLADAAPGDPRVVLVQGIEPSMRWRRYCTEILDAAERLGVRTIITIGALLADVPHTRPIPVTVSTEDPAMLRIEGVEATTYEGPTGIVGVLQREATQRGMSAFSVWAAVPHYVAHPPSPKATLALLSRIEELVGRLVPLADLPEDAEAWQHGVNELAAEDAEIAEYVQQLEEAKDTAELPEATGEAIAREFERYLRRRDKGTGA